MASKLTRDLREQVIAHRAAGWTAKRCADWLRTEHGVEMTVSAVTKLTRAEQAARSGDAKAIVRGSLAKSLPADLAFLQRIVRDYQRLYSRQLRIALADPDGLSNEPLHRLVEQARKLIETSLKFSGADSPDIQITDLAALLAKAKLGT